MNQKINSAIDLLWRQKDRQLFKQAIEELEGALEEGVLDAYYFLGRCYAYGEGVSVNDQKAMDYYIKGAKKGNAKCVLGIDRTNSFEACMYNGTLTSAYEEVTREAEAGDVFSAYMIGNAYYWGDIAGLRAKTLEEYEVLQKELEKKCIPWYRKASESGIIPAIANLCVNLLNNGTKEEWEECIGWCDRLINSNDKNGYGYKVQAYYKLEDYEGCVEFGESVIRKIIDSNDKRLTAYFIGQACMKLKNIEKAAKYFSTSVEYGDIESAVILGELYFKGEQIPSDYSRSFYFLTKAVKTNDSTAQHLMGLSYFYGKGCEKDYVQARLYFEAVINNQYSTAYYGETLFYMGEIYKNGLGLNSNNDRAHDYYIRAQKQMYDKAAVELANWKKNLFGKWKPKV